MTRRDMWSGWDQPALAPADLPPEAFEIGRLITAVVPLTADTATTAQLVHAGGCFPQCLISAGVPVKYCDCACRGVLADAENRTALNRRKASTGA